MAIYAGSVKVKNDFLKGLSDLESKESAALMKRYASVMERLEADIEKMLISSGAFADPDNPVLDFDALSPAQQAKMSTIIAQTDFIMSEMDKFSQNPGLSESTYNLAHEIGQAFGDAKVDGFSALGAAKPNKQTIAQTLAKYQKGTVWREYMDGFAKTTGEAIINSIVDDVITGEGIDSIVRNARKHMNIGKARLTTAVRTQVIGAAREGILDTYRANSDVVKAWIWRCAESSTTCSICWAMNGQVFSLDVGFATHPNCRCTLDPLPVQYTEVLAQDGYDTVGVEDRSIPDIDADERFAARLTIDEQRKVLGIGKYEMWANGDFKLADLVVPTWNNKWGNGLRSRSLAEMKLIKAGTLKKPKGSILKPKPQPKAPGVSSAEQAVKDMADALEAPKPILPEQITTPYDPDKFYLDAADVLFEKTSGAAGSNTTGVSGFWTGKDGTKRYVKQYDNPAQAYTELMANRIYERLGLQVPRSHIVEYTDSDGVDRVLIVNDILENQGTLATHLTKETADGVLDGIVADTWLANFDAVGTGFDNIVVLTDGTLARIDQGGSILFRAQGKPKPQEWLNSATLKDFWEKNDYYRSVLQKAGYSKFDAEEMAAQRFKDQIDIISTHLLDDDDSFASFLTAMAEDMKAQSQFTGPPWAFIAKNIETLDHRFKKLRSQVYPESPKVNIPKAPKPEMPSAPAIPAQAAPAATEFITLDLTTGTITPTVPAKVSKVIMNSPDWYTKVVVDALKAKKSPAQVYKFLVDDGMTPTGAKALINRIWFVNGKPTPYKVTPKMQAHSILKLWVDGDIDISGALAQMNLVKVPLAVQKAALKDLLKDSAKHPNYAQKAAAKPFGKKVKGIPEPKPQPVTMREVAPPPTPPSVAVPVRVNETVHTLEEAVAEIERTKRPVSFSWDGDGIEGFDIRVSPVSRIAADGTITDSYQIEFKLSETLRKKFRKETFEGNARYPVLMREQAFYDDGHDRLVLPDPDSSMARNDSGYRRIAGYMDETDIQTFKIDELPFDAVYTRGRWAYDGEVIAFVEKDQLADSAVMKALSKRFGFSDRKPSAPDLETWKENVLVAYFRRMGRADTETPQLRLDTLAYLKREFGLTPDMVEIAYDSNGRMIPLMPKNVYEKVKEKTGYRAFHHSVSFSGSDIWTRVLLNPDGLTATRKRWNSGLNVSGSSSHQDTKTGGADYVFTRPVKADAQVYPGAVINPDIGRRLDSFASGGDSYGCTQVGYRDYWKGRDTLQGLRPGSYEAVFKSQITWDYIDYVSVGGRSVREEILANLRAKGITHIGGKPIEEFVRE
jgi:SPP1 gp7 family putative phage head morphogenesis protein